MINADKLNLGDTIYVVNECEEAQAYIAELKEERKGF
jgi:hypothetical protein